MKKALAITSFAVFAAAAAYSGFWYYQAEKIKKDLKKEIADFESSHQGNAHIQYDSLDVTGYPSRFDIVIKNPHFQLLNSKDTVLKSASEAYVNGTIVMGSNITGTKVSVESRGEAHFLVPRPTKKDDKTISEIVLNGNVKCDLVPFTSIIISGPENLNQLSLDDLKEIVVSFDKFSIFITAPQSEKLMDIDNGTITYQSKHKSDQRQTVKLFFDLTAETYPQALGKVINGQFNKKSPEDSVALLGPGKVSIVLDSQADIPLWQDLVQNLQNAHELKSIPDLSLTVNKLDVQSKEFSGNNTLNFSLNKSGEDDKNLAIAFTHDAEHTPEYNKRIRETLTKSLKKEISQAKEDEADKESKPYLDALIALVNAPNFDKLIPNLPKTQTSSLDAKATFNNNLDFKKPWELSVNKYTMAFDAAGISIQGYIQNDQSIHGKTTLTIMDYPTIFKNSIDWYNQFAQTINPILAKQQGIEIKELIQINTKKQNAIDTFLHKISDNQDQNDKNLTITFNFEDFAHIRVGKLNILQLLMSWTQLKTDLTEDQPKAKE